MPWMETDAMSQRIAFVVRALGKREPFTALCREFGISCKTGYKWVHRYEEEGSLQGLGELSRRPHRSPRETPEEIVRVVEQVRLEYGWGGKKLQHVLRQQHGIVVPVVTIQRILKRRGLIGEASGARPARLRFERAQPKQL